MRKSKHQKNLLSSAVACFIAFGRWRWKYITVYIQVGALAIWAKVNGWLLLLLLRGPVEIGHLLTGWWRRKWCIAGPGCDQWSRSGILTNRMQCQRRWWDAGATAGARGMNVSWRGRGGRFIGQVGLLQCPGHFGCSWLIPIIAYLVCCIGHLRHILLVGIKRE